MGSWSKGLGLVGYGISSAKTCLTYDISPEMWRRRRRRTILRVPMDLLKEVWIQNYSSCTIATSVREVRSVVFTLRFHILELWEAQTCSSLEIKMGNRGEMLGMARKPCQMRNKWDNWEWLTLPKEGRGKTWLLCSDVQNLSSGKGSWICSALPWKAN